MSGGAADSALGSLFAAYGDTTDDEDSDIDVIDIDSDSSEVEEVLPRSTTPSLKRPSLKQLAHSRKRQAGVARLRVPGQGTGNVNPFKRIIVRECFDTQGNWLMHRRSRTCFKLDVM